MQHLFTLSLLLLALISCYGIQCSQTPPLTLDNPTKLFPIKEAIHTLSCLKKLENPPFKLSNQERNQLAIFFGKDPEDFKKQGIRSTLCDIIDNFSIPNQELFSRPLLDMLNIKDCSLDDQELILFSNFDKFWDNASDQKACQEQFAEARPYAITCIYICAFARVLRNSLYTTWDKSFDFRKLPFNIRAVKNFFIQHWNNTLFSDQEENTIVTRYIRNLNNNYKNNNIEDCKSITLTPLSPNTKWSLEGASRIMAINNFIYLLQNHKSTNHATPATSDMVLATKKVIQIKCLKKEEQKKLLTTRDKMTFIAGTSLSGGYFTVLPSEMFVQIFSHLNFSHIFNPKDAWTVGQLEDAYNKFTAESDSTHL